MSYHILKATLTQESAKVNVNASLVLYCVSGKFTQALSVSWVSTVCLWEIRGPALLDSILTLLPHHSFIGGRPPFLMLSTPPASLGFEDLLNPLMNFGTLAFLKSLGLAHSFCFNSSFTLVLDVDFLFQPPTPSLLLMPTAIKATAQPPRNSGDFGNNNTNYYVPMIIRGDHLYKSSI